MEVQDDKYNMKCPICGKLFHLKPSRLRLAHNHYCSKTCHYKAKKLYMLGSNNHQFGLKGERNPTWKGGIRISNHGYREIQCIGHPFSHGRSDYVFEHRLVAERFLLTDANSVVINGKRYLSPQYDVHHINGNRIDNRVENLEVMTKLEHKRLHGKEKAKGQKHDSNGRFIPEANRT